MVRRSSLHSLGLASWPCCRTTYTLDTPTVCVPVVFVDTCTLVCSLRLHRPRCDQLREKAGQQGLSVVGVHRHIIFFH